MNKEIPSLGEEYINQIIEERHEATASLAAQDEYDGNILEEAIFYDTLRNYPSPWESKDDHPTKGTVYHDSTEYDDLPPSA